MEDFAANIAGTGVVGLVLILVLGALTCYLLPSIMVLICSILVGFWAFGSTGNLVIAIVSSIAAGAYFTWFSFRAKVRAGEFPWLQQ